MTYTQIIKVIDTKRPTIVCPKTIRSASTMGTLEKGTKWIQCVVPSYSSADFKTTIIVLNQDFFQVWSEYWSKILD